jgi:hypothetical protein
MRRSRSRRPLLLAAVAALSCLAARALPAAAQDGGARPPVHPTRDASVTYRAEGGPEGPVQVTLSWLDAGQAMRTDMPGDAGWMVTEMRTGRAFVVNDARRMVMTLPADPAAAAAAGGTAQHSPGMRFTRAGTETILGHRCTLWRFQDAEAQGEACVTEDGVMLRSRGSAGQEGGSMTATAVSLAPQDPARFRPPQGYQVVAMPLPPGASPAAPQRR